MCLVVLASFHSDPSTDLAFVAAANRDEFFARATSTAEWWTYRAPNSAESVTILSGRDLERERCVVCYSFFTWKDNKMLSTIFSLACLVPNECSGNGTWLGVTGTGEVS